MLRVALVLIVILILFLFLVWSFSTSRKLRGGGTEANVGWKFQNMTNDKTAFIIDSINAIENYKGNQINFNSGSNNYRMTRINASSKSDTSFPLINGIKPIKTDSKTPNNDFILAEYNDSQDKKDDSFKYFVFIFNNRNSVAIIEPEGREKYDNAISAIYFVRVSGKATMFNNTSSRVSHQNFEFFKAFNQRVINNVYERIDEFKQRITNEVQAVEKPVDKIVIQRDDAELERLKTQLKQMEALKTNENQYAQKQIEELEKQIEEISHLNDELNNNKITLEINNKSLTQKIEELELSIESLNSEIQSNKDAIEKQKRVINEKETLLSSTEKENARFKDINGQLRKTIEDKEGEIEAQNTRIYKQIRLIHSLSQEKIVIDQNLVKAGAEIKKLRKYISELEGKLREKKDKYHKSKEHSNTIIKTLKTQMLEYFDKLIEANKVYLTLMKSKINKEYEIDIRTLEAQARSLILYADLYNALHNKQHTLISIYDIYRDFIEKFYETDKPKTETDYIYDENGKLKDEIKIQTGFELTPSMMEDELIKEYGKEQLDIFKRLYEISNYKSLEGIENEYRILANQIINKYKEVYSFDINYYNSSFDSLTEALNVSEKKRRYIVNKEIRNYETFIELVNNKDEEAIYIDDGTQLLEDTYKFISIFNEYRDALTKDVIEELKRAQPDYILTKIIDSKFSDIKKKALEKLRNYSYIKKELENNKREFYKQLDTLEEENDGLKSENQKLKEINVQFFNENEKIKYTNIQLIQEYNQLKSDYDSLHIKLSQQVSMSTYYEIVYKNKELMQTIERLENDYKAKIEDLEIQLEKPSVYKQNIELTIELDSIRKQLIELRTLNHNLSITNQQLREQLNEKTLEFNESKAQLQITLNENKKLLAEIDIYKAEIENYKAKETNLNNELTKAQQELEKYKFSSSELEKLKASNTELQAKLSELTKEKNDKEADYNKFQEECSYRNKEFEQYKNEAELKKRQYSELMRGQNKSIRKLKKANSSINQKLANCKQEIEKLNAQLQECSNSNTDLKNRLDSKITEIENLKTTINENNKKIKELEDKLKQNQALVIPLTNSCEAYSEQQLRLRIELDKKNKEIVSLNTQIQELEQECNLQNEAIRRLEEQLKSKNKLIQELEEIIRKNETLIAELETNLETNNKARLEIVDENRQLKAACLEKFKSQAYIFAQRETELQSQYNEIYERMKSAYLQSINNIEAEHEISINSLKSKLDELYHEQQKSNEQNDESKRRISELEDQIIQLNEKHEQDLIRIKNNYELDIKKLQDENKTLLQNLDNMRMLTSQQQEELDKLKQMNAEYKSLSVKAMDLIETRNAEIAELEANRRLIRDTGKKELIKYYKDFEEQRSKDEQLIIELNIINQELRKEVEMLKQGRDYVPKIKYEELLELYTNANNEYTQLVNQLKVLLPKLNNENKKLTKENERLRVIIEEQQLGINDANADLMDAYKELEDKLAENQATIAQRNQKIENLQNDLSKAQRCYETVAFMKKLIKYKGDDIAKLKARIKELENEIEANKKYYEKQAKEIDELKAKQNDCDDCFRERERLREENVKLIVENAEFTARLANQNIGIETLNRVAANHQIEKENESLKRTIQSLRKENDYLRNEIIPEDEVVKYVEKPVFVNASSAKQSIVNLMRELGENYNGEDVFTLNRYHLMLRAKSSAEFPLSDEYSRPLYAAVNMIPKDFRKIKQFTTLTNAINQLSGTSYLLVYKLKNGATVLTKENSNIFTLSDKTLNNDEAKVYAIIDLKSF